MPDAFQRRCVVCHQADGAGVPGVYPPIANTVGGYVRIKEGREFLIHLMLYGMTGQIDSHGVIYVGLMPPIGDASDAEISVILNYVLETLNKQQLPRGFKPIAATEVKTARKIALSPVDMVKQREKLLKALSK